MLARFIGKYSVEIFLLVLLVVVLCIAYFGGIYFGSASVERKQAVEQLKENERLQKIDERIDRETPDYTDKRVAIEWLRQHIRQE